MYVRRVYRVSCIGGHWFIRSVMDVGNWICIMVRDCES